MKKTNTITKPDLAAKRRQTGRPGEGAPGKSNRHGLSMVSSKEDFASLFGIETGTPRNEESFAEAFSASRVNEDEASEFLKRYENGEPKGKDAAQPAPRRKSKKQTTPEAELDLHGLRGREAEARTDSFVRASRQKGFRLVRIITGRGLHSPGRLPVLQDAVEARLRELKTEGLVRSYAWEKKNREDSGAILVNL